jgi:hypothetical protein
MTPASLPYSRLRPGAGRRFRVGVERTAAPLLLLQVLIGLRPGTVRDSIMMPRVELELGRNAGDCAAGGRVLASVVLRHEKQL